MKLDFDYWKELNENDPKRFEQERTDMLNKEIAKANPNVKNSSAASSNQS